MLYHSICIHLRHSCDACKYADFLCMFPGSDISNWFAFPRDYLSQWQNEPVSFLTVAGPRRTLTCFHLSFRKSSITYLLRKNTLSILFIKKVYHLFPWNTRSFFAKYKSKALIHYAWEPAVGLLATYFPVATGFLPKASSPVRVEKYVFCVFIVFLFWTYLILQAYLHWFKAVFATSWPSAPYTITLAL